MKSAESGSSAIVELARSFAGLALSVRLPACPIKTPGRPLAERLLQCDALLARQIIDVIDHQGIGADMALIELAVQGFGRNAFDGAGTTICGRQELDSASLTTLRSRRSDFMI
jgi:hypothetical protein